MNKFSKFQSIRFDSFYVSDLNAKLNQLCPILKFNQNTSILIFFYPKKQAMFSIHGEEGYQMNKFSKFQSIRFDSFHVSDLNAKRKQHRQFSNSTKIHPNLCFFPKKQTTLSIFSMQCEEGYTINKFSKFQSIRFDSFHVSDLNTKLNQHCQFSKSTQIHPNLCFLPQKTGYTQHLQHKM